jgi:hypothetical protein
VRLIVIAALVVGWIGWLAWLTLNTANPPIVNRVQLLASDLVIVGRWEDRTAGRLRIVRELKHGELAGTITVERAPPPRGISDADAEWIVPVRRTRAGYAVTSGKFVNRPERAGGAAGDKIDIPPQIYPATKDILRQIEVLLPKAAETPAPR